MSEFLNTRPIPLRKALLELRLNLGIECEAEVSAFLRKAAGDEFEGALCVVKNLAPSARPLRHALDRTRLQSLEMSQYFGLRSLGRELSHRGPPGESAGGGDPRSPVSRAWRCFVGLRVTRWPLE